MNYLENMSENLELLDLVGKQCGAWRGAAENH